MCRTTDEWNGRISVAATVGSGVRVGDWMFPKKVTVTIEPDDLEPDGRRMPHTVMRFEFRDGAPVCTELRVESRPGERPILSSELAVIDLEKVGVRAFSQLAYRIVHDDGMTLEAVFQSTRDPDSMKAVQSRVPASYLSGVDELRHVARVYLARENRAKPTRSVQDVLGYGSRETASGRIKKAREMGLIPAPGASPEALDIALEKLRASDQDAAQGGAILPNNSDESSTDLNRRTKRDAK
jgi:hypothetical protein